MKVLVAPDKSKGWLSAAEVAKQVVAELRAVDPDVETLELGPQRCIENTNALLRCGPSGLADDWFRRAG